MFNEIPTEILLAMFSDINEEYQKKRTKEYQDYELTAKELMEINNEYLYKYSDDEDEDNEYF